MKLSVHEAFIIAREKLPTSVEVELVFTTDEEENNKFIVALDKGMKPNLAALKLTHLGMFRCMDDAKAAIKNAYKDVDNAS
jgi:hypothetical protein